jgi:hypothetical protein
MSSLGKLNWRDALKTLILLILTYILNWISVNLINVQFVQDPVVNQGIIGMISFGLSYFIKQLGTDNKGKLLGKI